MNSSMFLRETNLTEVRGEIERLKVSASHGVDLISNKILKTLAAILAPFMTDLINQAFNTQEYPIDFNKAIVIALHKQGSRTDVNNHRPISILPSLSKIFQKNCVQEMQKVFRKI